MTDPYASLGQQKGGTQPDLYASLGKAKTVAAQPKPRTFWGDVKEGFAKAGAEFDNIPNDAKQVGNGDMATRKALGMAAGDIFGGFVNGAGDVAGNVAHSLGYRPGGLDGSMSFRRGPDGNAYWSFNDNPGEQHPLVDRSGRPIAYTDLNRRAQDIDLGQTAKYRSGASSVVRAQDEGRSAANVYSMFMGGGETGGVKALSSGAKVRSAAATADKASAMMQRANRLQEAGVTPYAAIASPGKGISAVTNFVAENPIAGVFVRKRLQNTLQEVGDATGALSAKYGSSAGRQITGENVQQGIKAFANGRVPAPASVSTPARETSFSAKAGKVYDEAFAPIIKAEQDTIAANANRAQRANAMGGTVRKVAPAVLPNATIGTLKDINEGINSPDLASIIQDSRLKGIATALKNDPASVRFDDLRRLRTWVREAQKSPELRQSMDQASLQRLEGALTQDIYSSAESLAGTKAMNRLKRADDFYRAGSQRINDALGKFFDPAKAQSGETTYSRIMSAAGSGNSADAGSLIALKRSLKPQEWGDVSANVLSEMGLPTAGAREVGEAQPFSINTFVTSYQKLSPRGKEVLFGSLGGGGKQASELRKALENLVWAADQAKKIEKGANVSKSGVSLQTGGTLSALGGAGTAVALGHPGVAVSVAGGLGSLYLSGEALTNPAALRIIAKGIRQRKPEADVMRDLSKVIDIKPYLAARAAANAGGASSALKIVPEIVPPSAAAQGQNDSKGQK